MLTITQIHATHIMIENNGRKRTIALVCALAAVVVVLLGTVTTFEWSWLHDTHRESVVDPAAAAAAAAAAARAAELTQQLRDQVSKLEQENLRLQTQVDSIQKPLLEEIALLMQRNQELVTETNQVQQLKSAADEGLAQTQLEARQQAEHMAFLQAGIDTLMTRAEGIMDRPEIAAKLITAWDTMKVQADDRVPVRLHNVTAHLRRCLPSVTLDQLPDIDALTGESCSLAYLPWRRYSSFAKLAYCMGTLPTINTFMDTFMSYGGVSILVAQGLLDAGKTNSSVFGWEIASDVVRSVRQKVEPQFSNLHILNASTLVPGALVYDATTQSVISAAGQMVDWCRNQVPDLQLVDGGIGTVFKYKDETLPIAEAMVGYHLCKPRFMLQVSANYHVTTALVESLIGKNHDYVLLASGRSRGVACGPAISGYRTVTLYARLEEL